MSFSKQNHQSYKLQSSREPVNNLQATPTTTTTTNNNRSNPSILHGKRLTTSFPRLEHPFEHSKINTDKTTTSLQTTTNKVSCNPVCMLNEALANEVLIERLQQLISEFMNREGRHYSYDTTIRWSIDHGSQIKYNLVILIKQPSDTRI
ncbi:unnamed protein product [Rotaria sp. Silwood1]|nr:unnamed protein product [Rotaria sp. Silwood1]CAF1610725.1 unnamed protein product [Rotaria sp. Silwood1]CAF3719191.1 unnamed protein product [Rotaria sp. Silwood1]CAF3763741.1 unnamed protein product [Rotaria sp. Silwood1]CAF3826225.1 unnamed protein product [Rotaria sp. Silwood1]